MKKIIFTLALCLFTTILFAQEKNFIDQNYIEVTGTAQLEISPDEIYVKVVINESDNKKKLSLEEQEKQMFSALETIGIDLEKEVFVSDYVSNFSKAIFKKDIYTTKEFTILAHSGKTVAEIFIELEELGISNISIDRLEHSEIQKYRKQVKIEAVKAAKEKASAMCEAIDQNVGKAIYIQEIEYNYPRPMSEANFLMRANYISKDRQDKTSDLDFEKIKLDYKVLVRFIIE